jgi:two-component system chemotaxis response regulator CheB
MVSRERDIVVVGTSAGGIDSLKRLVGNLPGDLSAAVFVILHIPSWRKSDLPAILTRAGRLPASHPNDGDLVQHGHIYVAPPDHHLLLEDGRVRLWRGPKENQHRPAINASFRSAAVNYRERVVGVVLSGMLDDGATGLWWVKQYGGIAVVQDPGEAQFSGMPSAAIEHVSVDYVAPVASIGRLIVELTGGNPRQMQTLQEDAI